ncbi:MAG: DUF805 domain-containing protein [Actinobacteria bacterium]|uniref:Unannotated protein n=1 Tax=freshwater metagenome TaxID=449393 RepID=A0A6J7DZC0_9ZZZZ|nr:DUF805 domain-containing protein [Actinomycetota bacterium]
MGFGEAISSGFSSMTQFDGRAKRSEFWFWVLFVYILEFVVYLVGSALRLGDNGFLNFIWFIVLLILWLATIAVGCRRLHDTGKSGWMQLLLLIPCVGIIIMIVFWAAPSQPTDNAYGPAA